MINVTRDIYREMSKCYLHITKNTTFIDSQQALHNRQKVAFIIVTIRTWIQNDVRKKRRS